MAQVGAARAIFLADGPRPVFKACDVGTVDLMVADVESLAEYRQLPVGWQRTAAPRPDAAPVHWIRAPEAPLEFAVPSHALRAGTPARLNLKVQMIATCDPRVHPEVAHLSAQGRLAWQGRDTQRLSLALYALPLDPAAPQQGIAAQTPADLQQISIAACGQRDAGAPFGAAQVVVRVVPATQWLTEVRHPAWPAMAWPGGADAGPITPPAIRLEADGAPRDASAWQRAWAELPARFRAGMDKLFNIWLRAVDPQSPRLDVEASAMVGEAGLTWGWRRTAASAVAMRSEGRIDLIGCAVDLRLAGELVHGTARARITLGCKGRSELRTAIQQLGDTGGDGQDLKSAVRGFRFPISADIEALASPELSTLSVAAMPEGTLGALAGECGLRPRPDGAGFQWFFSLRVEPVSVALVCADPVLGPASLLRHLVPAMPLVDWTAG